MSNCNPPKVFSEYQNVDEAYDLLQNGILVETNKGLVCMSLNDAIASDLNLSVEDLKNVASELISQQNIEPKCKEKVFLKKTNLNFDSDGVSSECSDTYSQSTFIALKSLPSISLLNKALIKNPEVKSSLIETASGAKAKNSIILTVVSDGGSTSQSNDKDEIVHKPPKRRGGWPKGRKRKPEVLHLPPKAPATGYNLYLNEQRKLFKDSSLVFHEITKVIGNQWSNLNLTEKQPFLDRADEDKKRYREELKQYRQSYAYRAYLAKKRRNRLQNNVFSESDMDATDEIDDEDNEELYCRVCDQWFHNLHNKREHLQGKQHTQTMAGEISRELSSPRKGNSCDDESSLNAIQNKSAAKLYNNDSVSDCINNLFQSVSKRENEINILKTSVKEAANKNGAMLLNLGLLKQLHDQRRTHLLNMKEKEQEMEQKVSMLWQVPSWFIISKPSLDFNDGID